MWNDRTFSHIFIYENVLSALTILCAWCVCVFETRWFNVLLLIHESEC